MIQLSTTTLDGSVPCNAVVDSLNHQCWVEDREGRGKPAESLVLGLLEWGGFGRPTACSPLPIILLLDTRDQPPAARPNSPDATSTQHSKHSPSSKYSSLSYHHKHTCIVTTAEADTCAFAPITSLSMSQGNPSFPGRNVYASSSKLPDRTALKTGSGAAQPYTESSLGRRPNQPYQFGQSTAAQQQHGALGGRQSMEKEPNALSELSEEQRDEINEAVCAKSYSPMENI